MTERVTIIEAKDRFKKGGQGGDKETKAPAFSEDAIALKFTERYGDDLRYVALWGKWLIWDGARWAFDSTVAVFDLARAVCREEAARYKKKTDGQKIASAKTRAAIESLVRADRRHPATQTRRLLYQGDGDLTRWRLPEMAGVPEADHGRR